ncbi:MAG: hypothetical protein K8S25_02085 [Alphaproteobacteria bacterium]|nr:hypothetical protein [Alphaproteobacteria bacterium]
MIMSRLQTLADPLGRKKFTGPLDIRAPEDHLVMEHKRQEEAPITSPAIEASLEDFDAAMRSGMKDAVAASTKKIVDATSAYFRMSGVPTFAHDPVPPQLIKAVLPAEHLAPGEHTAMAAHRFVDLFEDCVKPMLREQVMRHVGSSGATGRHVLAMSAIGQEGSDDTDASRAHEMLESRRGTYVIPRSIRSERAGSAQWRTMGYNPARDGVAGARAFPWDGQPADAVPLAFTDQGGSSAIGMIPGGGTPPTPLPQRQDAPSVPLGPSSDKTFNPDLRRPRPMALPNEVSNGRGDRRRRYQTGNTRLEVPINEDEADVIAGLDYLNNLRRRDCTPVVSGSFVNDSTGAGVTVVDAPGGVVADGSASQFYPWEYLRALGRLARAQKPSTLTGAALTWRKPTEKANLEPDWAEAQRRYRRGDGSDAVIDPETWGVGDDADEFADKAQRAADGEKGFGGNLRKSIAQAQATGEPQFVDILLPGSGPLYGARGLVMGQYAIRVRGVVVVKDGKYKIVGRATIVDAGKFNYDQDGQRNRSDAARWALWATQFLPDPTNTSKNIADPGNDYSIRANRDADVEIWGVVR